MINTMCGPQPLQCISANWYRPTHHLGVCAHPMFHYWSFLLHTPNWPVALSLLLLHPPGTLPADIRLCENILTFKGHHALENLFKLTSCAASTASVSSDLKALYKSVIIIIFVALETAVRMCSPPPMQCFSQYTHNGRSTVRFHPTTSSRSQAYYH